VHIFSVLFILLSAILCPQIGLAHSIALTFDDGPQMDDTLRLTATQRNAAILQQLHEARIKSILFLTIKDGSSARLALAHAWGEQGHGIGNHTVTHPYFPSRKVSLQDYEKELLDCDVVIRDMPGYQKLFRFTYLKEGDTAEKRDGFRRFLQAQNYRAAPVSIDTSDWYYDQRLHELLTKNPGIDLSAFKRAYLDHLWQRAQYYDALSRKHLARSVKHVMLLHHNLINALFLRDVIAMFKRKGWHIIDANTAFSDPVYALQPNTLPAGESILWALAKQAGEVGLRFPAEDGEYEKSILDQLVR
jgi:peptidoglycan-N-acetylglucosamine deacetylase